MILAVLSLDAGAVGQAQEGWRSTEQMPLKTKYMEDIRGLF